jgi:hypothetical protein
MDLANSDWSVVVLLPPDGKDVGERLSATVAFFSLTDSHNGVLAAQRQQWITDPTGQLLKAAERKAGFDIPRQ